MPLGMEVASTKASARKKGTAPQFSADVCFGQTGCIKMSFGTAVGLGPGDTVRWGTQLPSKRGTAAPTFRPMAIVAKRLESSEFRIPLGMEAGLGPGGISLDMVGDPAPPPPQKGTLQPYHFWLMSIVIKRSPISTTAELL